jgi:hypothetical protein
MARATAASVYPNDKRLPPIRDERGEYAVCDKIERVAMESIAATPQTALDCATGAPCLRRYRIPYRGSRP